MDDHIQAVSAVQRENDLFFRRCAENLRCPETAPIDGLLQFLAEIRRTSPNRSTILAVVSVDGVVHAFGLRKARRGVVEIDGSMN